MPSRRFMRNSAFSKRCRRMRYPWLAKNRSAIQGVQIRVTELLFCLLCSLRRKQGFSKAHACFQTGVCLDDALGIAFFFFFSCAELLSFKMFFAEKDIITRLYGDGCQMARILILKISYQFCQGYMAVASHFLLFAVAELIVRISVLSICLFSKGIFFKYKFI